ncbi:hypothetical protein IEQ34_027067 [Dendrobium chrysotoxum]|uniref:Secreted protein n=1 Tax=Dendrobium chrysotoxum TaxID=161865 RepID=A0AAV7FI63_DENCH|nr:hypothetical protein IEQ34_027067 [Dendrobium chrysotoxum]
MLYTSRHFFALPTRSRRLARVFFSISPALGCSFPFLLPFVSRTFVLFDFASRYKKSRLLAVIYNMTRCLKSSEGQAQFVEALNFRISVNLSARKVLLKSNNLR